MTDEIDDFIVTVAWYLTENLIIPPNGTVPATKEERMQEWVHTLEGLRDGQGEGYRQT